MGRLRQNRKSILASVLCLTLLCLIAAALMAGAHTLTAERIAEQRELALFRSMARILPAESYEVVLTDEDGEPVIYAAISVDGLVAGHLVRTGAYGYSGYIAVVTAIADGTVHGVEIVDANAETPGLGQNILSDNFTRQFQHLTAPPTLVRGVPAETGQIQALTGATISSEAVVRAVTAAMETYEAHFGQEGG